MGVAVPSGAEGSRAGTSLTKPRLGVLHMHGILLMPCLAPPLPQVTTDQRFCCRTKPVDQLSTPYVQARASTYSEGSGGRSSEI